MKRFLKLLAIICTTQSALLAQETNRFTITFPGQLQIAQGSATLSDSSFAVFVFLGPTRPDHARIYDLVDDILPTTVFEFGSFSTTPPSGPIFNFYRETWDLIPDQSERLLGGHWYLEIDYSNGSLTAPIVAIPEPTSALLFVVLGGFTFMGFYKRMWRLEHDA